MSPLQHHNYPLEEKIPFPSLLFETLSEDHEKESAHSRIKTRCCTDASLSFSSHKAIGTAKGKRLRLLDN